MGQDNTHSPQNRPVGRAAQHDPIQFRVHILMLTLAVVIVLGSLGFARLEKRPLMDAFYFTIATVSTVGYGDVAPVTTSGRLMAVILIVVGVGTFLGVIANATDLMLRKRERRLLMQKLNMVIGVFFSEVGTTLLSELSSAARGMQSVRAELRVNADWNAARFNVARRRVALLEGQVGDWSLDLPALQCFLLAKRDFLLRLLENPVLLEHQTFTDLMRAVFHLTEELACRKDVVNLPANDRAHLAGDAQRVLLQLLSEWLNYMEHLQSQYPYIFSLAARMNPFKVDPSPTIL